MTESAKAQETSIRILDAAELLFVEHGFDGTSMRLITQSAAVNIAAVNYHFGSKDGLYRAVFERRAEPFARLTIANIDALELENTTPAAEDIVMAFIKSALQLGADPALGGLTFVKLLARAYVEPHPILKESMPHRYGEVVRRYVDALQKALPYLTETEVHWRFHFLTSAMFSAFAGNNVLRLFMEHPKTHARDPLLVSRMLLPFLVAGLTAPAAD